MAFTFTASPNCFPSRVRQCELDWYKAFKASRITSTITVSYEHTRTDTKSFTRELFYPSYLKLTVAYCLVHLIVTITDLSDNLENHHKTLSKKKTLHSRASISGYTGYQDYKANSKTPVLFFLIFKAVLKLIWNYNSNKSLNPYNWIMKNLIHCLPW